MIINYVYNGLDKNCKIVYSGEIARSVLLSWWVVRTQFFCRVNGLSVDNKMKSVLKRNNINFLSLGYSLMGHKVFIFADGNSLIGRLEKYSA